MGRKMDDLDKLIEAVENGDDDFLGCDDWIEGWDVVAPELQTYRKKSDGESAAIIASSAYRGSLDAAKALHDALLPGWIYLIGSKVSGVSMPDHDDPRWWNAMHDGNAARAWLLAILKAYRSQQEAT